MADNNNTRKSKRNFSLEKPVERYFEIEKDVEAVPVTTMGVPEKTATAPTRQEPTAQTPQSNKQPKVGTQQSNTTPPDNSNVPPTGGVDGNDSVGYNDDNGAKKWIIIALVIAAIAACAYFLTSGNKSKESTGPETPQIEQNDITQNDENANDSTANAGENNADETNATDDFGEDSSDQGANNGNGGTQGNSAQQGGSTTASGSSDNNGQLNVGSGSTPSTPSSTSGMADASSIEQMAKDVWAGKYGNNPARRSNLGSDYEKVQKRVNEMRRQGIR